LKDFSPIGDYISRKSCIFARERRAKLLTLGKMSKLFCPRLTAALSARNNKTTRIMEARLGDNVLISPEVTHKSDWTQGTVIDVEANPFVGMVISAKTADGEIYFEKANLFKPAL
jgi:hypothetical protein